VYIVTNKYNMQMSVLAAVARFIIVAEMLRLSSSLWYGSHNGTSFVHFVNAVVTCEKKLLWNNFEI